MATVIDGTDLILSVGGVALGYSTGCKITTSAETGDRKTKEASTGKWKENYIKSFSEQITADGVELYDGGSDMPTYLQLKDMMLKAEPITASYDTRSGSTREGGSSGCTGQYIITSLDLDAQAGDDAKYSITLQNYGAVTSSSAWTAKSTTEA